MKIRYLTLMCLCLAISVANGRELPNHDEYHTVAPVPSKAANHFANMEGRVTSMDEQRGVPTFIEFEPQRVKQSVQQTPRLAALDYLGRYSTSYGLSKQALDAAYVSHIHDTGRGGIIVSFRQRVNGIDLVRTRANVLMTRDLKLVAITGNLHDQAVPHSPLYSLSAQDAMARALTDVTEIAVQSADILDTGSRRAGYGYYQVRSTAVLAPAGMRLSDAVRVKPILYPLPDRLVPAYYVEMFVGPDVSVDVRAYGYAIAADDGRVVMRHNLTDSDVFSYRVWAKNDPLSAPADGPETEYTPHPTGIPFTVSPSYIPSALVSMEGFNTATPSGNPDPWLPDSATETTGNNVDAYADIFTPDGFTAGDIRADVTSFNTFDHTYDPTEGPDASVAQRKGAVTQLFYTNNWLHDYFYDSGFDEAAGNAQTDNYGRGGIGNDELHVQAQDHSGTNNANMSTPGDGASPRMQMYVWDGPTRGALTALGQDHLINGAAFGPQIFNTSGQLSAAEDGMGTITDACEPITNNIAGTIALVDRGNCAFVDKASNVQAAGAIGMIVANNVAGDGPPNMGGDEPTITIPLLSITLETGVLLRDSLAMGPVPVIMDRQTSINRDGTIDNAIVAHEWGHYIHRRQVECGNNQCGAQSEGWGDFIALMLLVREGDDYEGAFAVAGYSTPTLGDAPYFGIRRVPYSTDPAYNALTFGHIADGAVLPTTHPMKVSTLPNSQIHNSGEIWASTLFEGYTALLAESTGPMPTKTFDEARRSMADYIVAGMRMAPADPTYSEQLNAILIAAYAQNPGDHAILQRAFTDRGFGSCSESPARFSTSFIGTVEDFEIRGEMQILDATVDDSIETCDGDGFLDADETGLLTVTVRNPGDGELSGTTVTISSATGLLSFPSGPSATLANLLPGETGQVSVPVKLSETLTASQPLGFEITLSNGETCAGQVEDTRPMNVHLDTLPSTLDTVESTVSSWTIGGDVADHWRRFSVSTNNVWFANDLGYTSDTFLHSAPIDVSATEDFIFSFSNRYSMQDAGALYFDGGVIEVSTDGGSNWQDVTNFAADVGYDGVIESGSNPLAGRSVYSGTSPSWPMFGTRTINFGTSLAGQTVLIRFRMGTDDSGADFGWQIDDIEVTGTDNAPFFNLTDDIGNCAMPPIADAGPDQTVDSGAAVTLDASASSDPENEPLMFVWTQTAGPTVALTDADQAVATFTAPTVMDDTTLTFQVTVHDGTTGVMDSVDILVLAEMLGGVDAGVPDAGMDMPDAGPSPDASGPVDPPEEGCCQSSGPPSAGNLTLMMMVFFGIAVITRRRRFE